MAVSQILQQLLTAAVLLYAVISQLAKALLACSRRRVLDHNENEVLLCSEARHKSWVQQRRHHMQSVAGTVCMLTQHVPVRLCASKHSDAGILVSVKA